MPEDDFVNEAGIILTNEQEFLLAWGLQDSEEDDGYGSGLAEEEVTDRSTPNPLDPWGTLNPLAPWNLGPLGPGAGIKGPDVNVESGQSTLSPLLPWNLGHKASTLNPLDPWNLGSAGAKGPGLGHGFGSDQSTLSPLSPWNLGPFGGGIKELNTAFPPVKSTINPLAPWNLGPLGGGVKGPDMTVGPGQSTLSPLMPGILGPKPSTIDPLSHWALDPVGGGKKLEVNVDPSQSTLSPLSPWNLGPHGFKGSKSTEKSPWDVFGVTTSPSTRRSLAPWDLGVPGGGVKGVEAGQSTLNPLSSWNLGPKASTINPLDPFNMAPIESVGIKSQSTINPLSPWNIGPIGGVPKGTKTTSKRGLTPREEPMEEAPWGTGILTTPANECSATTRAPCQALTSPALSRCSGLLDPAPYQAACERELCGGAEEPREVVCQWAGEYASQCLEDGLCLEWRRMLVCPIISCQENEHFEECGPGCDLDCHQSSCTGDDIGPACYCDTHMVSEGQNHFTPSHQVLLDGRCQPKSECGVCLDSEGFSKREGDTWQLDSCTHCSCNNATVSCTITACTPLSCGLGSEAKILEDSEERCCPRQVCVPTVGECSTPVAPDCGEFQQAVTVTGDDGCTHFVCG